VIVWIDKDFVQVAGLRGTGLAYEPGNPTYRDAVEACAADAIASFCEVMQAHELDQSQRRDSPNNLAYFAAEDA
jgi:hypothetical protein